ncbi:MAG TPA: signal recognition particle-docking protein FtsY [bacterium]|nr:signal recognition particle-docking protein FtsY [bacterium]HPN42072.1 signal recognition particle-docking protein FtsY [bacterium]
MLSITAKLKNGLAKTKAGLLGNLNQIISKTRRIDENTLAELEEMLILSDLGADTAEQIIAQLREKCKLEAMLEPDEIIRVLKELLIKFLSSSPQARTDFSQYKPFVISIVGVNGTGKTTTIGKLAHKFSGQGHKVMLAAADTFRAAAIDQLGEWAARSGVDMIKPQIGADPASVAFDAVNAAIARNVDILLVDTAGRLHTKVNLMAELEKINRVLGRQLTNAPHETLLVMDATTGQNGLTQAKQFARAVKVSGIVLTKLDGTAKGGIVFSIFRELGIPVKYIGLGEKLDDLEEFDAGLFVEALLQ